MDWSFIGSRVLTSLLVAFGGGMLTLLTLAFKTYIKVERLEKRSGRARHENQIQFLSLKTIIKCLKTGKTNGELTDAEREIDDYLHSSLH